VSVAGGAAAGSALSVGVAEVVESEGAEAGVADERVVVVLLARLDEVPNVVGSLRVLMASVYETITVGRLRTAVIPLALFCTVAAMSLAVPHPYWEKPPSYWFM